MFTYSIRRSFLGLCCTIGIAMMSGPSVALAVTARNALCVAELITAGCRATTLVAQRFEAVGNKNANTAHAVAYAAQAANELLALINHWDDPVRAVGYSGTWLAYDLYQLKNRLSATGPRTKVSDAIDSDKQGGDGARVPTLAPGPLTVVKSLTDNSVEQDFDLLQRDLLPAIETVTAIASAIVGWQGAAEQQARYNRLQAMLSLSRMIRLCLEHRHESEMKYYIVAAMVHALLTIAEFTMNARVTNQLVVGLGNQGAGISQVRVEVDEKGDVVARTEEVVDEQADIRRYHRLAERRNVIASQIGRLIREDEEQLERNTRTFFALSLADRLNDPQFEIRAARIQAQRALHLAIANPLNRDIQFRARDAHLAARLAQAMEQIGEYVNSYPIVAIDPNDRNSVERGEAYGRAYDAIIQVRMFAQMVRQHNDEVLALLRDIGQQPAEVNTTNAVS